LALTSRDPWLRHADLKQYRPSVPKVARKFEEIADVWRERCDIRVRLRWQ
jgi:hypothetical protein